MKISANNKPAKESYIKAFIIFGTVLFIIILSTVCILALMGYFYEGQKASEQFVNAKLSEGREGVVIDYPQKSGVIYDCGKVIYDGYINIELSTRDIYKIEFINQDKSDYIILNTTQYIDLDYVEYIQLVPSNIVESGYEKIRISPIGGDGKYKVVLLQTINDPDFSRYPDAVVVDFEIKKMDIEIDEESYDKLWDKRAEAIPQGVLFASDDDYVPAKITVAEETYKADIRLKGDWTDHLESDKWSFRIKLDNECIWGMEKLNIHRPESRNNVSEYLFQQFYSELGGINLKYDFIDVSVNGVYKGVYAVEQAIDKRVVEGSLKREGPILRANDDIFWEEYCYYYPLPAEEAAKILTYSENKAFNSQALKSISEYAMQLLHTFLYTDSDFNPEDVFDVDIFAKYLAAEDCFGSQHGSSFTNMRLYFNPITARFEPISSDELMSIDQLTYNDIETISEILFKDDDFVALYLAALAETKVKVNDFLLEQEDKIEEYDYILSRDGIALFDYEVVEEKLKIVDSISENRGITARIYDNLQTSDSEYAITIENKNALGVTVKSVTSGDYSMPVDKRIIGRQTIYIEKSQNIDISDLTLAYTLPNFDNTFYCKVNEIKLTFFVAGHVYGGHGKAEYEYIHMHSPFRLELNKIAIDERIDFGVFTGDIAKVPGNEQWGNFISDVVQMGKDYFVVAGNHDLMAGEDYFVQQFGELNRAFMKGNNLFIILHPNENWSLDKDQQAFITEILSKYKDPDNIFVLTHQLMWFNYDDDRFNGVQPNRIFDEPFTTNFWDEVYPLFDEYKNYIYFIAGDVGVHEDHSAIECRIIDGNRYFIASGMGAQVDDNYLIINCCENGDVDIDIIPLGTFDRFALGTLKDHLGDRNE